MTDGNTSPRLVVIGSSAGGIEALSTLVSTLPADFPAPIVIAQHLDPTRPSHLGEILARRGPLPVESVTDLRPLRAGVVYVVPSNHHVELSDHSVGPVGDHSNRPKPSIDLLLTSAAELYGEGLIAVILTGLGSDGAAGARDVKTAGGTVVIQDPRTAAYPAMPLSLAPSTVDVVSSLDGMAVLLHDLVTGSFADVQPGEEQQLGVFLDTLRERSGIDFGAYKVATIRRRLHYRMVAVGAPTLADYARLVQRDADEFQRLVGAFLIKVTEFFRDPALFDVLRERILPGIIERARRHGNELRIWSAGCATGEEAYSLAMLVAQALGDELNEFNVRIFATDVDHEALAFARNGVYPTAALANVPPALIERSFTPLDGAHEVRKSLRSLVVFGQHDLGQRAPFPRIDLVLCRNVLIYFTPELQRRALQLFAFALNDDGHLVLGKSETVSPLAESFALEEPRLKVYRRTGERVLIPPARIRDAMPAVWTRPIPTAASGMADVAAARAHQDVQRLRAGERADALLLRLPVGLVVVDRRYDIQFINGAARRLLGIHSAAIGEDLIHLTQDLPAAALRAAIDAAAHGAEATQDAVLLTTEPLAGDRRRLRLTCYPQPGDTSGGRGTVVVLLADVTEEVGEQERAASAEAALGAEAERLHVQVRRLGDANRELATVNLELTDANAELHATNEELLVNNEEVQAATEEVETLNEELQATNEELETLNEELQATIEELNTTNDDLQARGLELENLAATLEQQQEASETERRRLAAVLASMADAVLVVDADGRTLLTNAAYDQGFGGVDADVAPEDEDGRPLPADETPWWRAARGETFTMDFALSGQDGARRWFEATGQPVRETGIGTQGVVVIRDVTERSLRRLQEQFLAVASHELRTPLTSLRGSLQLVARQLRGRDDAADPTRGDHGDRARRYADIALTQADRLGRLVAELGDVARLRSGRLPMERVPVDLAPLAASTVESAELLAHGQTVRLDAPGTPVVVEGDAGRLEQLLLNLLTNAITYAPGTDRIDVRLRVEAAAREAALEVQDYGQGIPAAELPNVFARFFQGERPDQAGRNGLGLGLYIVREIAAAHGGRVDVASTEGQGTTFTVRLPLGGEAP